MALSLQQILTEVPSELAPQVRRKLSEFGGPRGAADLVDDLQNPWSLLNLAARAEVSTVWGNQIIQEILLVISRMEAWMLKQMQKLVALKAELSSAAKAADSDEVADELLANQERLQRMKELNQEVENFRQTLEQQQKRLNQLSAERKAITQPLLKEWDEHNKQQTNAMVDKFNEKLDPQHRLDEEDKQVLNRVARAEQVQLKYPELIPTSEVDKTATPEEQTKQLAQVTKVAEDKADVNFELALASRLLQKDGFDPDTQNMKPSEAKNALGKLTKDGTLKTAFAARHEADRALAGTQASQVERLRVNGQETDAIRRSISGTQARLDARRQQLGIELGQLRPGVVPPAPPAPQFGRKRDVQEEDNGSYKTPTPFSTRLDRH